MFESIFGKWGNNKTINCPECKFEIEIQNISCNTCIDKKIKIIEKLKSKNFELIDEKLKLLTDYNNLREKYEKLIKENKKNSKSN